MRAGSSRLGLIATAAAAFVLATTPRAVAQQQQQHDHAAHTHAEAAKLKNPVKPDTKSIAAGKKLFATNCASCHGAEGKGDGKAGALLKPLPSNLADGDWKHGSSDGEIFTLIRDGSKNTGMKGFGGRIPPQDLWNLVNFVRTLSSTAKPSN
jgi:mono/diheme cytochrome c family protein